MQNINFVITGKIRSQFKQYSSQFDSDFPLFPNPNNS